jgi:hypothetical protein
METEGGSGGENVQITTRDVRLTERAIRESWDLPEVTRQAMLARLGTLISDPTTKTRAFLAAAKTLIAVSRVNLSAVDVAIRAKAAEDFDQRLQAIEAWKDSQGVDQDPPIPRIMPRRSDTRRSRREMREKELHEILGGEVGSF